LHNRRTHTPTHCGWLAATLATALGFIACVPPAPPEISRPVPSPPISEEEIKPDETLKIEIVDLNEAANSDGKTVTVSGRLLNRGTRPTRQVSVQVEALDKNGAVVARAAADPAAQLIPPDSTVPFTATFETRPDIDRYRVEAVAR
jgi:hypothetical protein